ncbi:MAG: 50S ribosomal protein L18e [Fervidicoccaceae archaeon]
MSRTGTTNLHRRKVIRGLRGLSAKTGQSLWERVAELLSSPRRRRIAVNLSKINRYSSSGEVIIVPGKVLGAGKIEKKITVIAESFSQKAFEKLNSAGCRILLLGETASSQEIASQLKGSRIKIIK